MVLVLIFLILFRRFWKIFFILFRRFSKQNRRKNVRSCEFLRIAYISRSFHQIFTLIPYNLNYHLMEVKKNKKFGLNKPKIQVLVLNLG